MINDNHDQSQSLLPLLSYRAVISLSFGLLAFILTLIMSFIITQTTHARIQQDVLAEMSDLAVRLAYELDRGMYERYRDIQKAAAALEIAGNDFDVDEQRAILETLQASLPDYSWIGIARPDGTVQVSTQGILEGADVSMRPWFIEGQSAPFVGDVHGALLLEPYLTQPGDEPLRLVDIALPLVIGGESYGVLGVHLNWDWARSLHDALLTDNLRSDEIVLHILSIEGDVLVSTDDSLTDVPSDILALDGTRALISTLQDEQTYLTAYTETEGYRDYPGLGWRILTTQPTAVAFQPVNQLNRQFAMVGIVSGLVFIGLGWILASWTTYPISLIAATASKITAGDSTVEIPQLNQNREVSILSQALREMLHNLREEIAQRTQAQKHLKANKEMLTTILSHMPVMVIQLDSTENVTFINQQALDVLEWNDTSPATLSDIAVTLYGKNGNQQNFQQIINLQDNDWYTFDTLTQQNNYRYISWSQVTVKNDSMMLIGIDLTEQRKLEAQLKKIESAQFILETASQGVILINEDSNIMLINRYIESLFQREREEMIGTNIDTLFTLDAADVSESVFWSEPSEDDSQGAISTEFELTATGKDGQKIPILVSVSPIYLDGELHILAFVTDISERKQQEKNRQLASQLDLVLEKERLVAELQDRFVQLVSHEFRTPLSIINSSADTMLRYFDKLDEDRIREKLQTVQKQVSRIVDVIENGLEQASNGISVDKLEPEEINLRQLVEAIIQRQTRQQSSHTIVRQIDDGTIFADRSALDHILSNILHNALKYSPENSEITIGARNADGQWLITIEDEGIGIPYGDIDTVFEPFFRSNNVGSYSGTGLGLTITKRYVQLQNGAIFISSKEGSGTTVMIRL